MKKRMLALFLTLTMALTLVTPAFGAKTSELSGLTGHEALSRLPDTLQRPALPTTLEQIREIRFTGAPWDGERSEEVIFQEIVALTSRLTSGKGSDVQKMKAIYDWTVENLQYDYEAYQYYLKKRNGEAITQAENEILYRAGDPLAVYLKRKAICEGYARLCWLMGTLAGIPVAFIVGGAAGGAHAWNAALVDGEWLFFDATWGEWDMAPNYHTSSSIVEYLDGVFHMEGYVMIDNVTPVTHMKLRKGFESPAKVTVPALVTDVSIPGSTTLTEVILPEGVNSVYFQGCTNLTKVNIPNSLTVIGDGAFSATGLTSIEIPRGTTEIGHSAFSNCTKLTSVTIPANVTTLREQCFRGCTGLETVTIANASLGTSAFYECTNLKNVNLGNGVPEIGQLAFMWCHNLKEINIPGSVASIGDQAFMECENLETVTFNEGLKTIGKLAFFQCTNLKKADLPDSITTVDGTAFTECPNLNQGTTLPGSMIEIPDYKFRNNNELTSYVIPDHVTKIGSQAFMNCKNLKSVTIPESVATIDNFAFCGSALERVVLPGGITEIAYSAFGSCSNLTSVILPESVTKIGGSAFAGDRALTSINIPAGVTVIGDHAFQSCTSLPNKCLQLPAGVTELGKGVFTNCFGLTSIEVPSKITAIKEFTFSHCENLKYVALPAGITSIESFAFDECENLTDIYFAGTEAQWNAIEIDDYGKEFVLAANVHFNSTMPDTVASEKPVQPAQLAYASTQTVTVDGKAVKFEMYALKDAKGNDTNYIKLRDLAYTLNGTPGQFEVGWNGAINIEPGKGYTANGSEMSTPYSGNRAYETSAAVTNVSGTPAALEAIMLKDDQGGAYTYYKLRDLGAAIGFTVDWSAEKGVYIETK